MQDLLRNCYRPRRRRTHPAAVPRRRRVAGIRRDEGPRIHLSGSAPGRSRCWTLDAVSTLKPFCGKLFFTAHRFFATVWRGLYTYVHFAAMRAFSGYASHLAFLARCRSSEQPDRVQVDAALDGEASRVLRTMVAVAELRNDGAFFSVSALANALARDATLSGPEACYYDPACGAGDLLLAVGRRLPIWATLRLTLQEWSRRLKGGSFRRTTSSDPTSAVNNQF
jgi:hypothetical protein